MTMFKFEGQVWRLTELKETKQPLEVGEPFGYLGSKEEGVATMVTNGCRWY